MDTIFIQIASYRDSELIHTINDCISKSKYPQRLKFGICWQRDDDDDSLEVYKIDERFKIIDIPYTLSKGVCWARSITNSLWDGETYSLQIDSHSRFVQNWDELIVESWNELGDENGILTGYPPSYYPDKDERNWGTDANICNVFKFDDNGTTNVRPKVIEDKSKKFIRAVHIAAGFIFSKGDLNLKVPYDKFIYFHGEEHSMMLRYFTNGYNVYCLNQIIVYHYYVREEGVRHWSDNSNWSELNATSVERLKNLFDTSSTLELGVYGLGTVRTLEDWVNYSGIDYKNKLIHRDTINGMEPPVSNSKEGWETVVKKYVVKCKWDPDTIPTDDVEFLSFMLFDEYEKEVYREDITMGMDEAIFNKTSNEKMFAFVVNDIVEAKPTYFFIWGYSTTGEWIGDRPEYLNVDEYYEI